MTRSFLGKPTSQNMIDVMLYLQQYVAGDTPFEIHNGISGTWYNDDRAGEGFVLDVAPRDEDQWELVASDYTYDGAGNQVWLIGNAQAEGDHAEVIVFITSGGEFGVDFNPDTVSRMEWGTLTFSFGDCCSGHVVAQPNGLAVASGMGFETVEFDITRLTPPSGCP